MVHKMIHSASQKVYTPTIFLSALLLFSVQPMIAKMILPELGGSPAVWQTVMLFFQLLLLAGYAYVHVTTTKITVKKQVIIHRIIVICALIALPFTLNSGTLFDRNAYPVLWLFETLIYSISVPFFVLSTTAPILQKWFSLTDNHNAHNPYFLYSASNAGSLIALLSYPFIIEPLLSLNNQSLVWSGLFVVFIALILYISTAINKNTDLNIRNHQSDSVAPPTWTQKSAWCFLSFVPSSLMLALTTHITTDIAAIPLLWIIPFSLYLISFMLVFSQKMRGYAICKKYFSYIIIAMMIISVLQNVLIRYISVWFILSFLCLGFLCIAVRYHGELVEKKPQTENLTYFYLYMSIGGALGGIFNAIIAPVIFLGAYEYYIILILSCVICIKRIKTPKEYISFIVPPMIGLLLGQYYFKINNDNLFEERNFFGISRVSYDDALKARGYFHGTTNHGMQSTLEAYRLRPQTYYSGINHFINLLPSDVKQKPMAMVGLGVGTSLYYVQKNQSVDIYEIDPIVIQIANDAKLFTYMRDCKGNKNVILGDARINLQKADNNRYGMMLMDAYSSDSLPVHLLTKEAMALYLNKLDDNGIIAFHISNRNLDLKPVLATFSQYFNLKGYVRSDMTHTQMTQENLNTPSEWVILTKNPKIFEKIIPDDTWKPLVQSSDVLWTDNYSSIFSILK